MDIEALYERLAGIARERVAAGASSEAGLARLCGMSQPHLHHVLKGKRALSAYSAGQMMRGLGIGVEELLWSSDDSRIRLVSALRSRIGPGTDAALTDTRGFEPFAAALVHPLINPVAARVAADPILPVFLETNDLILLDQNPFLRDKPRGGCWVIQESAGLRIRYVKLEAGRLVMGDDPRSRFPQRWRVVSLAGRNVRDIVRAQVAWMGRKMAAEALGPDGPARQSH